MELTNELINAITGPVPKNVSPTVLNDTDSMLVAALSRHSGFNILVKMMETRITEARNALWRVAADAPNRREILDGLQHEAHAANQFCSVLLMDVKHHAEKAEHALADQEQDVEKTLARIS